MSKKLPLLIFLSIILLISVIVSVLVGNIHISFAELTGIFSPGNEVAKKIIFDIRLPRVLNAVLAGSALSCSGIILQSLLRNNLAEPGLLGISAGAGLGAILIFLFPLSFSFYLITPVAFVFAVLTTVLIFFIAKGLNGKYSNFISSNKIILAGIAINAMLASLNGFLLIISGDALNSIVFWLNGSLSGRGWSEFNMTAGFIIAGLIFSILIAKELNVLNLGDELAVSLGLNIKRMQKVSIALASLLAGCAVAIAGIISFVGLVIPNISKLIIGNDYRYTVPCTIILGALFLVISDMLARIVIAPSELPVGVVTSFLGAPVFIWLIFKRGKNN